MSFEIVFPDIKKMYWTEYDTIVQNLAAQVKEMQVVIPTKGRPQQVVALGRGGFIPGVHLSHLLEIPLVPLMWQTRDGTVNEQIVTDKHTLIVDDINDSGQTLTEVVNNNTWNGDLWTAVLVNKTHSLFTDVDYVGVTGDNDDWISFPWER
tara:strand:+ start:336 stop:788 length:453 start_codon:yes stop_codon:yes gene_type:complete